MSLLAPFAANAATYTVPSFTGDSIQATINGAYAAGSGNTVLLPAGNYSVTSPITVPCNNGLAITGPVASPSTAVLNATYTGNAIFAMSNCTGITVTYLQFKNTSGIYFGPADNSGITITNNQFYNLPSQACPQQNQCSTGYNPANAAVFFDGDVANAVVNGKLEYVTDRVDIERNTFGDANSCIAIFPRGDDNGGTCSGVFTHTGTVSNFTVKYNYFYHLEEPIHISNLRSGFTKGQTQSVSDNVDIEYNYMYLVKRIGTEIQTGVVNHSILYQHNVIQDYPGPIYGSFALSFACCTSGYLQGSGVFNPGIIENDNVLIASMTKGVNGPPFGTEFWGAGAQGTNNLVEGNFANAFAWGFGASPWTISNNYICGTYIQNGGYISNEEAQTNAPAQSGNVTSATCLAKASTAATISPASGAFASAPTITLSDGGPNTSVWYTTDGSAPVPGSGTTKLYTNPFTGSLPSTVKAVGMWGVPPQPTSYPAAYGYLPSEVVTANYTATSGGKVGVSLTSLGVSSGSGHTLTQGGTMQLMATCNYSDGSTTTCNTSDGHGNMVGAWSSSNAPVVVNSAGMATGASAGSASVTATVSGMTAPAWAITVEAPNATLKSVSIASQGGAHALKIGTSLQMAVTCTYSDQSMTTCNTADSHGNAASAWTSNNTAGVTLSASGLAAAIGAGSADLTATVAGMTTAAWPLTVVTPALSSITLATTGNVNSITAGSVNQLLATCQYEDGSTTNCAAKDVNGNLVNPWTSSAPTVAPVSGTGAVSGMAAGTTDVTAAVTPTAVTTEWGPTTSDVVGATWPGWINSTYIVLGSQAGGYKGETCSFYLPPGTLTVGSKYDCGLIPAPTATTQGSAWQCWYTYTVTEATSPGGWVTGPLSDCGNLPDGSAWWVGVVTNQAGGSPAGFYDCGAACAGTLPKTGSGQYGYRYIAAPYGTRTGMATTMLGGGTRQAAQYVTLSQPAVTSSALSLVVAPAPSAPAGPTLAGIYLTSLNNTSAMQKGSTLQFSAWGVFSDGSSHLLPDGEGNRVDLWNTSNHAIAKVSTQGHVTALSQGVFTLMAYSGKVVATPLKITVAAAPTTTDRSPANGTADLAQSPQGLGVPLADNFGGPLWGLTAPAGGTASISQSHLFLGVPGGTNHDAGPENDAVRVVQPVGDEPFDVSIKIDSILSASDAGTRQGLIVVGDDHNFITYALETDGTTIGLALYTVTHSQATAVLHDSDLAQYQNGMYLRVTRVGSAYVAFYSVDGQDWIQATSFNSAIVPTAIGPFAANHNDNPAEAVPVVMSVGSFEVR